MCSTSPEAFEFAIAMAKQYKAEAPDLKKTDEQKNYEALQKSKKDGIKKDTSELKKVSEIDYAKHEKLSKELDIEDEIKYWQEAARKSEVPRPPGCAHDHQKEIAIYEKSTAEKTAAADSFRKEGNECFKKGNYGAASVQYRKALLQFDYSFPETEEEVAEHDRVKLLVHLNMAATKSNLKDWKEVLIQTRQALEIDPNSVKAHYRKGWALLEMDEFKQAKLAFQEAKRIEPGNADVLKALNCLRDRMEHYNEKTKLIHNTMAEENLKMKDARSSATSRSTSASSSSSSSSPDEVQTRSMNATDNTSSRSMNTTDNTTIASAAGNTLAAGNEGRSTEKKRDMRDGDSFGEKKRDSSREKQRKEESRQPKNGVIDLGDLGNNLGGFRPIEIESDEEERIFEVVDDEEIVDVGGDRNAATDVNGEKPLSKSVSKDNENSSEKTRKPLPFDLSGGEDHTAEKPFKDLTADIDRAVKSQQAKTKEKEEAKAKERVEKTQNLEALKHAAQEVENELRIRKRMQERVMKAVEADEKIKTIAEILEENSERQMALKRAKEDVRNGWSDGDDGKKRLQPVIAPYLASTEFKNVLEMDRYYNGEKNTILGEILPKPEVDKRNSNGINENETNSNGKMEPLYSYHEKKSDHTLFHISREQKHKLIEEFEEVGRAQKRRADNMFMIGFIAIFFLICAFSCLLYEVLSSRNIYGGTF